MDESRVKPDPKSGIVRDPKYLLWLRTQRCVLCGRYASPTHDVVPMHKGGGMGIKGSDHDALPGCTKCHAWEHNGAGTFWAMVEVNSGLDRAELVDKHRKRFKVVIGPCVGYHRCYPQTKHWEDLI